MRYVFLAPEALIRAVVDLLHTNVQVQIRHQMVLVVSLPIGARIITASLNVTKEFQPPYAVINAEAQPALLRMEHAQVRRFAAEKVVA